MSKGKSDSEIIELSLELLSPKERQRIRRIAQRLVLEVHGTKRRVQFGPRMAYRLLWAIGRYLNEE